MLVDSEDYSPQEAFDDLLHLLQVLILVVELFDDNSHTHQLQYQHSSELEK